LLTLEHGTTFNSCVESIFDREHVEGIVFDNKCSIRLCNDESFIIDEEDDRLEDPEEEDVGIEYAIHKENLANWIT
jgi:hypothetical protein